MATVSGKDILGDKKPKREKHERCGRTHSSDELVEKCEWRLDAKLAEIERREINARLVPVEEYIRQRCFEGMSFDKITAALKRDYPPPPVDLIRSWEGWSVGNVIELDTRRFTNWPV